ncbi:DUF1700 domain-containing protein [Patescibacteria group bacterium]|nr:DUF1700 domain-containing protein [Patescibacteria group bacterium]
MENFESQQFRNELAKGIKEVPKEERKDILGEAKETSEYWQARGEKISERQNEEEIDDGLGVLLKKKTIYHGSGTSGIEQFNRAEEDTVGSGIYFTSEAKDAIGYARRRSRAREGAAPVIYESSVENMKLLDLRKGENVKKVLKGFKKVLKDKLKESDLQWYYEAVLQRAVEAINSGKIGVGNLREATFSTGQLFSDYVKSMDYDGLVALEGGEGDDIGDHDTYLIFDPEKAKIDREHKIL